jgi:L-seryl-tRNA(Ser) seleniumtransferase
LGIHDMPSELSPLRSLPSVDHFLQLPQVSGWMTEYGRSLTLDGIRSVLQDVRRQFPEGGEVPAEPILLSRIDKLLKEWTAPTLQPVLNASGVVLHTNLGRAPLSPAALRAASLVSAGYSNLEYDLEKGRRGSRTVHAETLLQRITGAEAALVVNNNAAAVLLALTALAHRKVVVVARSQLVEIGGGFRVPDIMKQSGARLLEVGTTNRVHVSDLKNALEENPALFLRVHRSNFAILGFTSEPTLEEMAQVAHRAGIPLIDDLGSGSLLDTARYGLGHEPMVQESLAAGADLVCFSGDKLLGGPQAGILAGRTEIITKLKKHPLARALRADKLCLAALSATLLHYVKDEAEREIPVWRMISASPESLRLRAQAWVSHLGQGNVITGESTVGGGSLPGETLPTFLLALSSKNPNRLLSRLRQAVPPVIPRLMDDRLVRDPRTILPEQEDVFLQVLGSRLNGEAKATNPV